MKKVLLSSLMCASMLFAANTDYQYEVTPMLGGAFTEGNTDLDQNYANAGVSLGFNLDDSMFDQIELGILRTLGDVDYDNGQDTAITRIFTNWVKEYKLTSNSALYGLIGAGVEIFENEQYQNEDGLFGNYGVGYKYIMDNGMALKADLRHLIEADHGDNTLLYTVGLAIPFGAKGTPAPAPVVEKKPEPKPEKVMLDSDRDGVYDDYDMCPTTPLGSKVDTKGCAILVDLDINFDTDSAVIKPQYQPEIKAFANYLKDHRDVKATIEAHTDSRGSNAYNQKLSERRAASAVQALEDLDINATRLNSVGYGETKPMADNTTAEGRAQNRRVHAKIER